MFKAIYGCFNLIFLIVVFKMFAPGLAHLIIEFFTSVFTVLNDAVNSMNMTPF